MTEAQREKYRQKLLALHAELTEKAPAKIEPNRTDEARVGGDEDEPRAAAIEADAERWNRLVAEVSEEVVDRANGE